MSLLRNKAPDNFADDLSKTFDFKKIQCRIALVFRDSSLVQLVERRTVNPYVAGPSPVGGATLQISPSSFKSLFLLLLPPASCSSFVHSQVRNLSRFLIQLVSYIMAG